MAKSFNLSIKNLLFRLRKFDAVLNAELRNEIFDNEDLIIRMVIENQLYEKGIEGRGIEISSYMPYRPRTIIRKRKKGQPTNRVTLKDTGEFYRSLHLEMDSDGFYIKSDDDKAQYLLKKYGTTIFRLTNENLSYLIREKIRPSLSNKLKNKILNG